MYLKSLYQEVKNKYFTRNIPTWNLEKFRIRVSSRLNTNFQNILTDLSEISRDQDLLIECNNDLSNRIDFWYSRL